MIKKSIQTVFNKPVILIGFAILILVPTILYAVLFTVFMPDWLNIIANIDDASDTQMIQFMLGYIAIILLSMGTTLATMIFGMSPLLSYIGEVCHGQEEPKWYIRGLKKGWWRLIVYIIIAYISILPIIFVSMILTIFVPVFGMVLYFLLVLAWCMYFMIGLNIVIIEDNFGKALGNIFTVGSRYIFKYLGAAVIAYIPTIALSVISAITTASKLNYVDPDNFELVMQAMSSSMSSMWIYMIVAGLLNVILIPFLMTYNTNNYLKYREIAYQKKAERSQMQYNNVNAPMPTTNNDIVTPDNDESSVDQSQE